MLGYLALNYMLLTNRMPNIYFNRKLFKNVTGVGFEFLHTIVYHYSHLRETLESLIAQASCRQLWDAERIEKQPKDLSLNCLKS